MNELVRQSKRTAIGILGGLITVVGIILIPYPGPGWLIVFLGLGVLATEFTWARRILTYAKSRYHAWSQWLKKQNLIVRLIVMSVTAIVVIVTIWLLNGYGMIDSWLSLDIDWAHSPIKALEFLEH